MEMKKERKIFQHRFHNQESKHDFHQHPVTFIENAISMAMTMDELKKAFNCTWCHQPLLHDDIYFCFDCPSFVFHKKCLDHLPPKIHHPYHFIHPLFLQSENNHLFCNLCQNKHFGYFYSCSHCHVHINIECAWPRPIVEDERHHQHTFALFWKPESFICDACDTEGRYISYICSTCCVIVHKHCTKLSRIIKFSRHVHRLFHKYFLEKQELTRKDCKICFQQVKVERGSYSCVKEGCNYEVHVNCALENKELYDVIEQEYRRGELDAATQSSIIRVIEKNKDGEATKIEHSFHEGHCLVLADKTEEETNRKCVGCMLPVSTLLFYYCSESECHYCLHKTCAEFPKVGPHWLHRSNSTLQSRSFVECNLCRRYCSGFFYQISGFDLVCLRCAKVPDIIDCEGHQHLISFDFKRKMETCNGCGATNSGYDSFRCRKCSFSLDFSCLTLPPSILHNCDQHLLSLTYHDDNDYKEHCYCDICEEIRYPTLWY